MIPDPYRKTVKIPIKIINGTLYQYPDKPLPKLKDGTIGDLVVPSYAFREQETAKQLNKEHKELFLPAKTVLIAEITVQHIPKHLRKSIEEKLPGFLHIGVKFILLQDQLIQHRGSKNSKLQPCKCKIPSIDKDAKSINHAYSLISRAYEPHRISHTGNVFSKVYYKDKYWHPLKQLRGY